MIHNRLRNIARPIVLGLISTLLVASASGAATLPDGRSITPVGFTTPVEGFASSEALSPDGTLLAVLSEDGGAIDVIVLGEHTQQVGRISVPWATAMVWTKDGLYVARGYSGNISRFTYKTDTSGTPLFSARSDVHVGGLLNGIAEDPATHRIIVARTANKQVDVIDDRAGSVSSRLAASGQPFSVGLQATPLWQRCITPITLTSGRTAPQLRGTSQPAHIRLSCLSQAHEHSSQTPMATMYV